MAAAAADVVLPLRIGGGAAAEGVCGDWEAEEETCGAAAEADI